MRPVPPREGRHVYKTTARKRSALRQECDVWLQHMKDSRAHGLVDMALLTECGSVCSSAVYKHFTPIGVKMIEISRPGRLA